MYQIIITQLYLSLFHINLKQNKISVKEIKESLLSKNNKLKIREKVNTISKSINPDEDKLEFPDLHATQDQKSFFLTKNEQFYKQNPNYDIIANRQGYVSLAESYLGQHNDKCKIELNFDGKSQFFDMDQICRQITDVKNSHIYSHQKFLQQIIFYVLNGAERQGDIYKQSSEECKPLETGMHSIYSLQKNRVTQLKKSNDPDFQLHFTEEEFKQQIEPQFISQEQVQVKSKLSSLVPSKLKSTFSVLNRDKVKTEQKDSDHLKEQKKLNGLIQYSCKAIFRDQNKVLGNELGKMWKLIVELDKELMQKYKGQ